MSKATRLKSTAEKPVPQTREQVTDAIAEIGRSQRERARIQAAMNDEIAAIKLRYEEMARPHGDRITELSKGVQTWCEANRQALTDNGKSKTAALGAGEVRWRTTPPSCSVKAIDKVIETLRGFGLSRFLREKVEIDKAAILADPEAVKGIRGITISQREEFVIVPFETELEEVA